MDPETVAKIVGAVGLTGALATSTVVLWRAWQAEREGRLTDAKTAADKLDALQDAQIKAQAELIKALTHKEAA